MFTLARKMRRPIQAVSWSRFITASLLTVFFLFAALIGAALIGGCGQKQQDIQISETKLLMDTFCTITIHGDFNAEELESIIDRAFQLCAELEALFSITDKVSDVWRINHAGGEPVTVDSQTIDIIKAGLEFGKLSGGMFDITIGRVSRLWDFSGEPNVPSEAELNEAIETVDYRGVIIFDNTVQLTNSDAWIDLGAIAKGYIADKIAGFLAAEGVSGALIDLGGDVVTLGNRQDGSPWRIALRDPFGDQGQWLGTVEVSGVSVLGSGIYERRFEADGKQYHHILDPYTGMPVTSDVASAFVIADNAMVGEGLSTIAVLLGSERGSEIFEQTNGFIGAVIVLNNGELLEFGDVEMKK